MDETDVKILKRLLHDARMSYRKVAEVIGVSPPTVLARVGKLEKEGIIKSYSAMLDHERQIAKFPNVCAVYDITGLTDMTIIAKFKNRAELSNFVKKDLSLPYVERTNTHVVLITVKEDFRFVDA